MDGDASLDVVACHEGGAPPAEVNTHGGGGSVSVRLLVHKCIHQLGQLGADGAGAVPGRVRVRQVDEHRACAAATPWVLTFKQQ